MTTWKLVPQEPTHDMLFAGLLERRRRAQCPARETYQAMLAAAPPAPDRIAELEAENARLRFELAAGPNKVVVELEAKSEQIWNEQVHTERMGELEAENAMLTKRIAIREAQNERLRNAVKELVFWFDQQDDAAGEEWECVRIARAALEGKS